MQHAGFIFAAYAAAALILGALAAVSVFDHIRQKKKLAALNDQAGGDE